MSSTERTGGTKNMTSHVREKFQERGPSPRAFPKLTQNRPRPIYDGFGFGASAPERDKIKKAAEEWIEERQRTARDYPFSLTILPGPEKFDVAGLPLADGECAHGRLPGDPTPPCGCHEEGQSRKSEGSSLGPDPAGSQNGLRKGR